MKRRPNKLALPLADAHGVPHGVSAQADFAEII